MQITIDENHIYRVDGIIKAGTTTVVSEILHNGVRPMYFNDSVADRGDVVHEACALLSMGKYRPGSVDERLAGYVESARKALDKFKLVSRWVEQKFFDPVNDVCGTIDWGGAGIYYPGKLVMLDWKTGVKQSPDWELQGAGYVTGAKNHPFLTSPSLADCVFIDAKLHKDGKCATLLPITNLMEYMARWPKDCAEYYRRQAAGLIAAKGE